MTKPTVSTEYAKTTCRFGEGPECCRYLIGTADGLECAKLSSLRTQIDARAGSMKAKGDNCAGIA